VTLQKAVMSNKTVMLVCSVVACVAVQNCDGDTREPSESEGPAAQCHW